MTRTTSKASYLDHKASGQLGKEQTKIMHYLFTVADASRREIAEALGLQTSSVSGRVNELLAANVITELPVRKCGITRKTIRPVCA